MKNDKETNSKKKLFGVFNRRVEFYRAGSKIPFETVNVLWWDLQYLWQHLDFTDVTQGTIYMDFDAEVSKETLQQLIDYFLSESKQENSIYAHELWQKNIAKDLFDLQYGLEHPRLKR